MISEVSGGLGYHTDFLNRQVCLQTGFELVLFTGSRLCVLVFFVSVYEDS